MVIWKAFTVFMFNKVVNAVPLIVCDMRIVVSFGNAEHKITDCRIWILDLNQFESELSFACVILCGVKIYWLLFSSESKQVFVFLY